MDYFTRDTDRSIERFQSAEADPEKHSIFDQEIRPAFEKLIESLIYVNRFYTLGDVPTMQRECLTDLYNILPRFDASKSSNPSKTTSASFSYFNKVAKNWFIARARENNKRARNDNIFSVDFDHDIVRRDPSFVVSPYEADVEEREMWLELYRTMDSWRHMLKKPNERRVLEAIIFIMKNTDSIAIYNKKAVYIYLRDLTGLNTKQIVVSLKRIRELYGEWHERYCTTGVSEVVP